MTASLRRVAEGLWVILLCRISGRRFRRHHRAHARHLRKAAHHADAMAAELLHRAVLCTRYGGRPGPSAPRTGSGVPAVPLPSRPAADSLVRTCMVVPDHEGAPTCPEDGEGAVAIAAKGGLHPF